MQGLADSLRQKYIRANNALSHKWDKNPTSKKL